MKIKNANLWWGPPKKFSIELEERKVSWLELFYDLVYVIAISRITHHLAEHPDISGLLDYTYFFAMIFWGWLNGSLYHDLHGTSGLRTSLMTLWQMMIVAALVVTTSSPPENLEFNITICVMVMQLYITYLWWSVGIYDKAHRKLNMPYTIIYLASLALLFLTLWLDQPYVRIVFYLTLVLNYLPPFVVHYTLQRNTLDFNLSSSMTERMGLFTIIIFGEAILGVVNGIIELNDLSLNIWLNFGLAILIVFALWWIFFTLISDRPCKPGLHNSSIFEIIYIPTLMGLGLLGVAFSGLFESFANGGDQHADLIKTAFGITFCLFLSGINALLLFLEYPVAYQHSKKRIQQILLVVVLLFLGFTLLHIALSLTIYLLIVLTVLGILIFGITRSWLTIRLQEMENGNL